MLNCAFREETEMKKLLTAFGLFAMVASLPVLAVDADREGKMEQAQERNARN